MRAHNAIAPRRPAFTLIELLVVIAIIALLVTLLVPALQEAKRQAKVVICCTNLRSYAMGLILYANEDDATKYPPHDIAIWGNALTVWSSVGGVYPAAFPNKTDYLTMFRDEICGGNFRILWCPVNDYYYNVFGPHAIPGLMDPAWPGLWYDGRFGQNYMGGYVRFANLANANFAYSRNSQTDGPPVHPGSSKDAIVADQIYCWGYQGYQDSHILGYGGYVGEEALKARRENDVAYGDGHVEIHDQEPYFDGAYLTWDGCGWVLGYGNERIIY